jgi:cytochrome P450
MRRARHDTIVAGQPIAAGQAVTAWLASANRDEGAFRQPYRLDFARTPNPHIVFGTGPHTCLGTHLTRMMLRNALAELCPALESFELADEPVHLASNEIAGVVSLPLRTKFRV